jgi:hypothetical protein
MGVGGGRSQIIRRRESLGLYKSFNTLCKYWSVANSRNVGQYLDAGKEQLLDNFCNFFLPTSINYWTAENIAVEMLVNRVRQIIYLYKKKMNLILEGSIYCSQDFQREQNH